MDNAMLWERYTLSKVTRRSPKISHYIGSRKTEDGLTAAVLINELSDREKIELYISDFLALKTNDPLKILDECFTHNSNFYVVFRYSPRQDVVKYLKNENPSYTSRIQLMKSILEKLLAYAPYPEIILSSAILPANVLVEDGNVDFNIFLDLRVKTGRPLAQDVYSNIAKLLREVFSEKELENAPKLSIIKKKLNKLLYKSIPEVIHDLDELYRSLMDDKNFAEAVHDARKGFLKKAGSFILVCSLILLIASLFVLFGNSRRTASVYRDTTEIGTVRIGQDAPGSKPEAGTLIFVHNGNYGTEPDTAEVIAEPPERPVIVEPVIVEPVIVEPVIVEPVTEEPPAADETHLAEAPAYTEYTVIKGDNLYNISERFYNTPDLYPQIAEYNGIPKPQLIFPGEIIKLPAVEILTGAGAVEFEGF